VLSFTYSTHLELDISIQLLDSREPPERGIDLEVASRVLSVSRRVFESLVQRPADRLHGGIGRHDLAEDLERLWARVEEVRVEVPESQRGVIGDVVGNEGC
jgi:hypothetical protein